MFQDQMTQEEQSCKLSFTLPETGVFSCGCFFGDCFISIFTAVMQSFCPVSIAPLTVLLHVFQNAISSPTSAPTCWLASCSWAFSSLTSSKASSEVTNFTTLKNQCFTNSCCVGGNLWFTWHDCIQGFLSTSVHA